jgi:hypothetical protein
MTISVIIPAYNASGTIRETLDSVLAQTAPPDEILVMDDGSTDETASIVANYAPRITLIRQENRGVASARNTLCANARGDLVAFLDSDDLWHPRYLERQRQLFESHSECVAFFTGHIDFCGGGPYQWDVKPSDQRDAVEVISPLEFLKRINWVPRAFATPSCCIPRAVLRAVGDEPFKQRMSEDLYLFHRVAPLGSVVYSPSPLAAVRIRRGSLSSDSLALAEAMTRMCGLLESCYEHALTPALRSVFRESFAMKRRHYAKLLLGAGEGGRAREQLRLAIACSSRPISLAKSLSLLFLGCMPRVLQPEWPSAGREGLHRPGTSHRKE